MNNIGKFWDSLNQNIEKTTINADVFNVMNELRSIVKPMYLLAENVTFKDDRGTFYSNGAIAMGKGNSNFKNPIRSILTTINTILDNEEDIHSEMVSLFNASNVKEVMDYQQLNALRYIEGLSFFSEYAKRWLEVLTLSQMNDELRKVLDGPVSRNNHTWTVDRNNSSSFNILLRVLDAPVESFMSATDKLKGNIFNHGSLEAISGTSVNKLDPKQLNVVPVRWNLIYHIGLTLNIWHKVRHERNKEELSKLQLLLLALREESDNTKDGSKKDRLSSQIIYHSNRINKLNAKLEAMEER